MEERILAAFTELSRARGFSGVTMDEVAAAAGMSKRTLYRYFRSKDQLIEAVIDRILSEIGRTVEEITTRDESPVNIIAQVIEFISTKLPYFLSPPVLADLRRNQPLWEKISAFRAYNAQKLFDRLITKSAPGYFRPIDPRIVSAAILASLQAVATPDFVLGHGLTLEQTAKQLICLFMYGIINDQHRAEQVSWENKPSSER